MNSLQLSVPPAPSATDGGWQIVHRDDRAVYLRADTARRVEPEDWPAQLRPFLEQIPGVVAVGAKRMMDDGHVFAMGEFVIHPKGFHHHGSVVTGIAYRFPEEVDLIAGGVLAVDRDAFEAAGGLAVMEGQLGAIELGLRLRHAGGRCLAVPQVLAWDESTPEPDEEEARAFFERWGFDWQVPDLDVIRHRYAGTGLLWNARFWAPAMPYAKYEQRPAPCWTSYGKVDCFRQRADKLAQLAADQYGSGPIVDVGSGDGLFTHLVALRGPQAFGVEPEAQAVTQARQRTAEFRYPGPAPTFLVGRGDQLPLPDGWAQGVLLFDVIEHLTNPVAVLREIVRVLRPGGGALIVTPAWQYGGSSDPFYHGFEYTEGELRRQVAAIPGLELAQVGRIGGVYRDLVVMAQRRD